MARKALTLCVLVLVTSRVELAVVSAGAPPSDPVATTGTGEDLPTTVVEARGRARILHETIHGVLQVVHRDFFRPDDHMSIPSRSLEDVFKELARSWQVQVHWLVVNAEAMNIDNKPRDDFEKDAVKALASGKPEFEAVAGNVYRFAGSIRLASQCLKCHVPSRTSTEDRAAGVVITMPLRRIP
jgi:hypothetical protein